MPGRIADACRRAGEPVPETLAAVVWCNLTGAAARPATGLGEDGACGRAIQVGCTATGRDGNGEEGGAGRAPNKSPTVRPSYPTPIKPGGQTALSCGAVQRSWEQAPAPNLLPHRTPNNGMDVARCSPFEPPAARAALPT